MNTRSQVKKDVASVHAMGYFNVLKTASWVEVLIKEALKPLEITHAQLNVLSLLAHRHPKPMSAGAVKNGIIVASPDITRLIDRLMKKELVHRQTCPDNRRQMEITITKKGMSLFHKAHDAAMKATDDFFKDKITKGEARQLSEILTKIRT